ncbi:MAG: general secretion pathway protein J [Burkholderiales bacterium PBB3]|nr:MAG: general secretion pathway protein J [Burkholderiales bacterium PBB3]
MAISVTSLRLRNAGFTLIELLVAIGVMALMAGLTWRGLDGIARTQERVQARADKLLTLQAGLAQWTSDLDAIQQIPGFDSMDWDGRALRLTRHTSTDLGSGLIVVAWVRRDIAGTGHWIRWQSPPVVSREQLQAAWARAAQWGQNPSEADKRLEVVLTALQEWRIFYFRGDAWSNPLSSDSAAPPGPRFGVGLGNNPTAALPIAPGATVPDGVRIVLTLPPDGPVGGTLTRDWIRPTLGGGKS